MIYVGESMNIQNRMYSHKTSKRQLISKAILKHGVENFEIYVEYFPNFEKKDLIILEEQLIHRYNCVCPNGYNFSSKGVGMTGQKHTEDAKHRMSINSMGEKNPNYGKKMSPELKEKLNNKGKFATPATKLKMSIARKGKRRTPTSEETKQRISIANKGRKKKPISDETKLKMSIAKKGKKRGPISVEIKQKMSNALLAYHANKRSINSIADSTLEDSINKLIES